MTTSYYYGMRSISSLLGILVISLLFSGCRNTEGEETSEKRGSAIPISIQFLNADSNSNTEPQGVTVEIYDPKGNVFTPIGNQSSAYSIENGFLSLVVGGNKSPNHDREVPLELPYRFTIKSTSNGYLEKTQTIVIDDYQSVYAPVFMMPLENMPAGSSFGQRLGVLGDNGVTKEDIEIFTKPSPKSGDKGITATLFIKEGTQLYGACKKYSEKEGECKERCKEGYCRYPIADPTDSVNIEFYQFDPRFEASANAFPNGFLVTDAVDNQGVTQADLQNSFFFSSLGYINLSMNVGKEEVKGFSQPVTMVMEVPSDLKNPVTGESIKETSEVPLWSLNETTGQWTNEDNLTLYEDGGKLFAKFEMNHLSTWNLDHVLEQCSLPPIEINISNTGSFEARYAEIFESDTYPEGIPIGGGTNNILLLRGGGETHNLRVKRAPKNLITTADTDGLQFRIYNSVRKSGGVESDTNIDACGDELSIVLDSDSQCVHFRIQVECVEGGGTTITTPMILTGLWYQKQVTTGGAEPEIQYEYANYTGNIINGEIDVDMTDIINNAPDGSLDTYRFKLQKDSSIEEYDFHLQYNKGADIWDEATGEDDDLCSINYVSDEIFETCTTGKFYIITLKCDSDHTCSSE